MHFLQILATCSRILSVGGFPGDVRSAREKWKMTLTRRQWPMMISTKSGQQFESHSSAQSYSTRSRYFCTVSSREVRSSRLSGPPWTERKGQRWTLACSPYRERDHHKHKYWAQDRSELVHEPEGRLHKSVEYIVTGYVLIVEEREEGDPQDLPPPSGVRFNPGYHSHPELLSNVQVSINFL